ncbi:hypothetical protein JCM15124A_01410 [Prevotella falsenii]
MSNAKFIWALPWRENALFEEREKNGKKPVKSVKETNKNVKIFHKYNYRVTIYPPACYKTYCFAFQNRRFCTVKPTV